MKFKRVFSLKLLLINFLMVLSLISGFKAYALPSINEKTMAHGIKLLFVQESRSPITAVQIAFKGAGIRSDDSDAHELMSLMIGDIINRDLYLKRKTLHHLGVNEPVEFDYDPDNIYLSFRCPGENVVDVLKVVREAMEINKRKLQAYNLKQTELNYLDNNENTSSNNNNTGLKRLSTVLFKDHVYGKSMMFGMRTKNLSRDEIIQAVASKFAQDNLVISVVGNTNFNLLQSACAEIFSDLPVKHKISAIPKVIAKGTGQVVRMDFNMPQSSITFGQRSVPMQEKAYFPFMLANEIMGGQVLNSRLFNTLREKHGLIYSVNSHLLSYQQGNMLWAGLSTDHHNVSQTLKLVKGLWKEMKEKGVSETELDRAKKLYKVRFFKEISTTEGLAKKALQYYLLGLGTNFINEIPQKIESVNLEEINNAAAKYFEPAQLTFVVLGPKR